LTMALNWNICIIIKAYISFVLFLTEE